MTPHSLLPRRSQYLPRSWSIKPTMGESSCDLLTGNIRRYNWWNVLLHKYHVRPYIRWPPIFPMRKQGYFFSQNNTVLKKNFYLMNTKLYIYALWKLLDQACKSSSNALDVYSWGARFESQPWHQWSWLRFLVVFSFPPHRCWDSTLIKP